MLSRSCVWQTADRYFLLVGWIIVTGGCLVPIKFLSCGLFGRLLRWSTWKLKNRSVAGKRAQTVSMFMFPASILHMCIKMETARWPAVAALTLENPQNWIWSFNTFSFFWLSLFLGEMDVFLINKEPNKTEKQTTNYFKLESTLVLMVKRAVMSVMGTIFFKRGRQKTVKFGEKMEMQQLAHIRTHILLDWSENQQNDVGEHTGWGLCGHNNCKVK